MVSLVSAYSARAGERISVTLTDSNGVVINFQPPQEGEGGSVTLALAESQVKQLRDLLDNFYTISEQDAMEARG